MIEQKDLKDPKFMDVPVFSGHEKEMFDEIDRFLGISAKYSPKGVRRTKILGFIGGLALAAVLFFASGFTEKKTCPIVAGISFALMGFSMLFFYGNKAFPAMISLHRILETDGVKRVYDDMRRSVKINGTSVYLGDDYIFDCSGSLYRMSEVKNVFIYEFSGMRVDSIKTYYACVEFTDNSNGRLLVKRITGLTEEKRIQQFMDIKVLFEERCSTLRR